MSLHFPIYIVIIDLFQIIGEPFIPHSQQAEEAGLARPLTAHQTQHQFKFDAGVEHPADGTQHENFQALGVELAFFCPQESVQGVWNAELPVPAERLKIFLNGMEAVFIGNNADGIPQCLLMVQMVVPLKIQFEVAHVPFRDGTACPLPANIAHDAVPLGQHVESNGSPQVLVMLQNENAVVNGLQDIVLAVLLEIQKYLLSCHCHGFVYQSSSPPLCNARKRFSLLP